MLRVAWLGTYVSTQHDDFEATVERGEIDLVHDQDLAIGEARIALDAGITKRLGISAVVPIRFVSTSIRYLAKSDGAEVDLAMPGIHHRDETLTGLGDPMLLGSYGTQLGSLRLVLRGGLAVPLGSTEDNPFTADADTTPHQHVQMGAGTFRPVAAVDLSVPRGAWRFGGFLFTQQSLYENGKGYQAGDRYAAGLAVSRTLAKRWSLRGGAELQAETAEQWDGIVHTDDGNRGRLDAMFTAGASYAASDRLAIDATIKVPFVTHAVGGQLEMPAILEVGAAWRFGALAKQRAVEEEHGHAHGEGDEHGDHAHGDEQAHADEHGDHAHGDEHAPPNPTASDPSTTGATPSEPAPTRPDVAAYAKPGEAPDLVPVAGKLTIFDFWAPWCQPCKTLDPALVALAAKYPALVAIRKLDVVDWDSAAAERYLTPNGFDLPHVKIFDAQGKRILEKSSAPGKLQALIDEVRALVEAAAQRR